MSFINQLLHSSSKFLLCLSFDPLLGLLIKTNSIKLFFSPSNPLLSSADSVDNAKLVWVRLLAGNLIKGDDVVGIWNKDTDLQRSTIYFLLVQQPDYHSNNKEQLIYKNKKVIAWMRTIRKE